MFVYLITNLINGNRYVGQTSSSIVYRWTQHKSDANTGQDRHLHNAIRKYGSDNFEIKPLVEVNTKEEMDLYERGLIKAWDLRDSNKGYNLTDGGEGCLGLVHTEETKALLRANAIERGVVPPSRKGCKQPPLTDEQRKQRSIIAKSWVRSSPSEETRKKLSEANKGKTLTEEHKKKIAARLKGNKNGQGRVVTEEQKQHLSAIHTGRFVNEQWRKKLSESHKGKTPRLGTKHTEESRRKMSASQRARQPLSEEIKKKMALSQQARRLRESAARQNS